MTLSLRDINGCDSSLFNYRHFSKISILNDTLQRGNKKNDSNSDSNSNEIHLGLDRSLRQIFDKPLKSNNEYEGENWSEAVCSSKARMMSDRLLNIDSDSVLDFSLASARKLNNLDGSVQLFTPTVVANNSQLNLDELNAHLSLLLQDTLDIKETDSLLMKLGLQLIPQTVKLNQALTRFDNDPKGKATNKSVSKFVEFCNQSIDEIWLPYLAEGLNFVKQALQVLETFKDQYTKVELKTTADDGLKLLIHQWSMLNYFPMVLINSLNFKVLFPSENIGNSETQMALTNNELFKILFVTLSLEISKTFIKSVKILMDLKAYEKFENSSIISTVATLLDSTVETHTGEIMIGIGQLIREWITERSKIDPLCTIAWNQWSQSVLQDYRIRFRNDISAFSSSTDEGEDDAQLAELMFDKFDVGRIFVEEIFKFTQPEKKAKPTFNGNSLGWLTIFDENENNSTHGSPNRNGGEHLSPVYANNTLRSLFPPISSRNAIVGSSNTLRTATTANNCKKAIVKQWAHTLKQKFQDFFHLHRQPSIISSVRYYRAATNAANLHNHATRHLAPFPGDITIFAEDQRSHVEKLTKKLYKKEEKGRRKRDALRVIFS
ncbi:ZYRO0A12474p [Zygosaccharomyces rouxii]|uniref:ZYRO0A12474p n=1 Tax=Zygosaccharomyces rouxii (strain ATCC 2623 / CBS 732 / NBRC 1130 / NCYC 568 / NRRL Y-229) TaxID=559307 RepID=C5DNX8_ZYGRC|nr:uncharacterized protein ZYRO0A12474g [Zygosaccharomyces rouxii]KAH9198507.1 hypothetical protein LQ764DRAFT_138285 [Zygosaccharomyces rouxii]CAR25969.1 ZYRO0A12474p [Zygosaccharomyces rouxii]